MKKNFIISTVFIFASLLSVFAQEHTENKADQTLRGSGRVNPSTLGMEFSVPLGSYPGRGINLPISMSYSSKVWRMNQLGSFPRGTPGGDPQCVSVSEGMFGEYSASGWTSSMQAAYVEYTGLDNLYNGVGFALAEPCYPPLGGGNNQDDYISFVRRIQIHLPGGESHELRMDDSYVTYLRSCTTCNAAGADIHWNGWYHAVDGSNLKYYEDRTNDIYILYLPDGSKYNFADVQTGDENYKKIRKAENFADRNGNQITYHAANSTYPLFPNGYWIDTLGRVLGVPVPANEPSLPTVQEYKMPGLSGSPDITYKFHWKKLKDTDAASSALTNFNDALRYTADFNATPQSPGIQPQRSASSALFHTQITSAWVVDTYSVSNVPAIFNPVLLAAIELPNGQFYRFSYNIYGEIDTVEYPTGGSEAFVHQSVPTLTKYAQPGQPTVEANRGVSTRSVHEYANDPTPYTWTYVGVQNAQTSYQVTTTNPDGTRSERLLYQGKYVPYGATNGDWGFDRILAGMAFEERYYSSANQLLSKTSRTWTKTSFPIYYNQAQAEWHPRVTDETSNVYDTNGNGISTTTTFEYEAGLNLIESPVLRKKSSQYAFVPVGSALPSQPEKISESTFLINDPAYSSVASYYTSQNIVGLVTVSKIKNGSGTVVSQSEMEYDDTTNYPLITPVSTLGQWTPPSNGFRGNPNTSRVWDSTKGVVTNPANFISTHAQFDNYGNQRTAWDALGNATITTFDTVKYAFPLSVTSVAPDQSGGTNGSTTGFTTTATYDLPTGLPLTTIDANGLETRITYDTVTLRPLNTKNYYNGSQVGGISETIYHDESLNSWVKSRSQIDDTYFAESISYFDGLGRAYKSEKVDSNGNIFVEKEFDADGRVSRVTNPFRTGETKKWTTNIYDEASRVKQVDLPDTSKVLTDYAVSTTGIVGVTKMITDQAGKKRKGYTDALGNMVRVIEDPANSALVTDYVFDTLGNLRKTTQGEQNRYFMHDSLGRLLYAKQIEQNANSAFSGSSYTDPVTSNNQWSEKYVYNDSGNMTTTTDAKNNSVTATYDHLNRIIKRNYSDTAMPDVDFYYDGKGLGTVPAFSNGKTTKVTSTVSETRYTAFDVFGRLLAHRQTTDGNNYDTGYVYNLGGALVEQTYPSGRVVKNTIDQDGSLSQVQSRKNANYGYGTYASGFAFDTAGNVKKMRLGNGRWETASYNDRQQVTQIGLGTTDAATDLLKLEYKYDTSSSSFDNNGSMREQKITVPTASGTSGFAATQTYTYDDLNRIASATENIAGTQSWKQTFDYDRYGNRRFNTTGSNTTTLGSCSTAVCNPTISTSTNRISQTGYAYDANGNLTIDGSSNQFLYDAENHQKEVKDSSNNSIGTYVYDGEGRRVKKVAGSETTIFVYDGGGQMIAEYSTVTATTPQVNYITQDHLGSPRVITNESGTVIDRKDYAAFGDETISTQRSTNLGYTTPETLREGYTGYEKDSESGLDYAQARYYNSSHGRFTSVDPLTASASIKNPQTFNRYSYVLNSPYKFVDPLGLIPDTTTSNSCNPDFSGCEGSQGRSAEWNASATATPDSQTNQADPPIALAMIHEAAHIINATPALPPLLLDEVVSESESERQRYNCLAWALGFTNVWIEPINNADGTQDGGFQEISKRDKDSRGQREYLPMGEAGRESLGSYSMVKIAGYYGAKDKIKVDGKEKVASLTSDSPTGYYKMVVFEGKNYRESHVMRQDQDGTWSSKNGPAELVIKIKNPEIFFTPSLDQKITYLYRKTEKLGKR